MIKIIKRKLIAIMLSIGAIIFIAAPMVAPIAANAQGTAALPSDSNYGLTDFDVDIGREDNPDALKETIAQVINIVLGFLGIIAVIIILYAGFRWMTAAGNEDKVGEAKKMIVQGAIGLALIFLAWTVADFVIDQLKESTGVGQTTTP